MKIKYIKKITDLLGTTDGFGKWTNRVYNCGEFIHGKSSLIFDDIRKNWIDLIMGKIRDFTREVTKSKVAIIEWIDFDTIEVKVHQKNREWHLRFELGAEEFTRQSFILGGILVEVYQSQSNEIYIYTDGRYMPSRPDIKSANDVVKYLKEVIKDS